MILNLTSSILKNLLIHDFDQFLSANFSAHKTAISPIMTNCKTPLTLPAFQIVLKSSIKSFFISIFTDNLTVEHLIKLKEHLISKKYQSEVILSNLFRHHYKISIIDNELNFETIEQYESQRIDLSIINSNSEFLISIVFPVKLLALFSKKIITNPEPNIIEREIVGFFKDPVNIFPNFRIILETFNDKELQKLLIHLQKNNLLSIYQICLMILSFPQNSLRIKRCISSNVTADVTQMMKTLNKPGIIKNRDLTEGVYSVDESIYFLMKSGDDFSYSQFLADIQKTIEMLYNIEILLIKDFKLWIEEMSKSGLLYKTLSITSDITIAGAISDNPELYNEIFREHISERKLNDINNILITGNKQYIDLISNRSKIISNYRKLKFSNVQLGDESFEYLIRRFSSPLDYNNLLHNAGWFVLSTALKGIKKKYINSLFESIPLPAKYLIEDVLRGVINPNIIHDDMQIQKARAICVGKIISLYEDGFIHLIE